MHDLRRALVEAVRLTLDLDADLLEIIALSLWVSGAGALIAAALALPLGAQLAVTRFAGRGALLGVLNALMGLPPVVVGLFLYMALSRSSPLGVFELLYTPTAMIIAQAFLAFPIIASLTCQTVDDARAELGEQLRALGCGRVAMAATLMWETRLALLTVFLTGFGRAVAEVGAVLIVGGNIDHVTRVMTTAIVLETGKGNLPLALALGLILLGLFVLLSFFVRFLQHVGAPAKV